MISCESVAENSFRNSTCSSVILRVELSCESGAENSFRNSIFSSVIMEVEHSNASIKSFEFGAAFRMSSSVANSMSNFLFFSVLGLESASRSGISLGT